MCCHNMIQSVHTAGIEVRESGHPKIQRNKIYGHESSGGVYVHHYGRAGHHLKGVVSVHVRAFSVRSACALLNRCTSTQKNTL